MRDCRSCIHSLRVFSRCRALERTAGKTREVRQKVPEPHIGAYWGSGPSPKRSVASSSCGFERLFAATTHRGRSDARRPAGSPRDVSRTVPERHIGLIGGAGLSRRRSAVPSSSAVERRQLSQLLLHGGFIDINSARLPAAQDCVLLHEIVGHGVEITSPARLGRVPES